MTKELKECFHNKDIKKPCKFCDYELYMLEQDLVWKIEIKENK